MLPDQWWWYIDPIQIEEIEERGRWLAHASYSWSGAGSNCDNNVITNNVKKNCKS